MQAHIFISGFVQGVGYRHFVRRSAENLKLTGWVKNLPDRRVEVIIQGPKEKIEEMILKCRKGPFLAVVEDIQIEWIDTETPFNDFSIIS